LLDTAEDPSRSVEALFPQVYDELRSVARRQLARMPSDFTLQPTDAVHLAYERLVRARSKPWAHSREFFLLAARAVREVLIEYVRRRSAAKRGGGSGRVTLGSALGSEIGALRGDQLLDLAEGLRALERTDARAAQVVELCFFLGLTAEEAAAVLEVSLRTVRRDWRFARACLSDALGEGRGDGRRSGPRRRGRFPHGSSRALRRSRGSSSGRPGTPPRRDRRPG
jgi:RNA polymerase sigma factor (TIGR02999 family)